MKSHGKVSQKCLFSGLIATNVSMHDILEKLGASTKMPQFILLLKELWEHDKLYDINTYINIFLFIFIFL
jgi:hypothetical protein